MHHPVLREFLLRDTVADVQQHCRADHVAVIEGETAVDTVQDDTVNAVTEIVLIFFPPVVSRRM